MSRVLVQGRTSASRYLCVLDSLRQTFACLVTRRICVVEEISLIVEVGSGFQANMYLYNIMKRCMAYNHDMSRS